jgi:hypothetical protein
VPNLAAAVSITDDLRDLVARATPAELPALAGDLLRALATVLERTAKETASASTPTASAPELLDVATAANRLGVTTTWLYRHARDLPFTRKLGHRTLRFDARGLDRWAHSRQLPNVLAPTS